MNLLSFVYDLKLTEKKIWFSALHTGSVAKWPYNRTVLTERQISQKVFYCVWLRFGIYYVPGNVASVTLRVYVTLL